MSLTLNMQRAVYFVIYECSICGYKYDPSTGDPEHGIKPGIPFEELPDDWTCPICMAGKDMFTQLESTDAQPPADNLASVKEYHSRDIIVHWYPQLCSHAGKCWDELPPYF